MNSKQKGDIAEQYAIVQALQKGWDVLKPIGDRLPYDLVFCINNKFIKIQVKYAGFNNTTNNYIVDTRRSQTNQRNIVRKNYTEKDFDFALIYIEDLNIFYVVPVEIFISYKSSISITEDVNRQRKTKISSYKNNWELINVWATNTEMF